MLQLGTVALDGTKIHANASRHSALSYEHAGKIEAQLKSEVAELLARAEAADQADVSDGMSIPEELARREERLAKLAEARAKLDARAKERFEREMAEHRAKLAARDEKTAASGKKPGGSPPAPPLEGPQAKDQINLTDEDSRIMPVAGGGFEQCYNGRRWWRPAWSPISWALPGGNPKTPQFPLRPGWLSGRLVEASWRPAAGWTRRRAPMGPWRFPLL